MQRTLKESLEKAGLAHRGVHALRHTLDSMAKRKLPLPLLKSLVGHSDEMDTLGVYGHEITGEMESTADILDEIFDELLPESARVK